jgi:hypothetical protein
MLEGYQKNAGWKDQIVNIAGGRCAMPVSSPEKIGYGAP